jgi:uncharacterized membrane protein (DUF106 family)
MKGMKIMLIVMIVTMFVALLWDSLPIIKDSVHLILDPTAGKLLLWNVSYGMLLIAAAMTLITTLLQKYTTDQVEIKRLKEHQKKLQEEMKKYKDNPQKMMDIQKQTMELTFNEMMPLTMKPLIYTAIPFILLFRWFGAFFTENVVKVFGMNWILGYIVLSIIFSLIFRKVLKVQ